MCGFRVGDNTVGQRENLHKKKIKNQTAAVVFKNAHCFKSINPSHDFVRCLNEKRKAIKMYTYSSWKWNFCDENRTKQKKTTKQNN